MNPSIDQIRKMINSLPKKDYNYAKKFLDNRDFKSLMELIDSDIYLVRANEAKETPKEEYNVNLEDILNLKTEVEEYMSLLILPEDTKELDIDIYGY